MFPDFAVYPVVAMYRQAIELKIKSLALAANRFTRSSESERVRELHGLKLAKNWDIAKDLLPAADIDVELELPELTGEGMLFTIWKRLP
jgi:hypothetical protein